MEKYYCDIIKGNCEHGGSKRFNYGFVNGTDGWCFLVKKRTAKLDNCPKVIEEQQKDIAEWAFILQGERDADGFVKGL